LLIACSPSSYNVDETIGTLRFGTRAKKIKNKAKINVDKTVAEYKKDIAVLTDQLQALKKKYEKSSKIITQLKAQVQAAVQAGFVVPDIVIEEEKEKEKETEREEEEKENKEEQNNLDENIENGDEHERAHLHNIHSGTSWDPSKEAELQQSRERVADAEQRISELESQLATFQSKHMVASTPIVELPSKEIQFQVPHAISDLSPELLQKARAGLQMENKLFRDQTHQLQQEIEKMREQAQIKEERLNNTLQKSDEIEMECDKLMSQQEMLEETIDGLTREKLILEREKDEKEKQMQIFKQHLEDAKKRIEEVQKEADQRVHLARSEECKKANEFIMEAQQQIQQFKRNQVHQDPKRDTAVGKLRDKYVQDMKAQQRTAQLKEAQMKEFEEEMIAEINTIRFEYMKLKTALQNKTEDYTQAKLQVSQKEDEIKDLQKELNVKETKIKQQNDDLQEFGKMKKEADKNSQ